MASFGATIKNILIFFVLTAISVFASLNWFLYEGLIALVDFATGGNDVTTSDLLSFIVGTFILVFGVGLGLIISITGIVNDDLKFY